MKIGYARVSTDDQNLDLQRQALAAAGCTYVFTDQVSGTASRRPGLDDALARCEAGDVLVVWRLDRLGRSLSHLIEVIHQLGQRDIGFVSLSENIDTTTAGGSVAKIVKLEHAWRRLDGRNDDGFQVAPFPG